MCFFKYGNYLLDVLGNVFEVFVIGVWNLKMIEFFIEEMYEFIVKFDNKFWVVLMDGCCWVFFMFEC